MAIGRMVQFLLSLLHFGSEPSLEDVMVVVVIVGGVASPDWPIQHVAASVSNEDFLIRNSWWYNPP